MSENHFGIEQTRQKKEKESYSQTNARLLRVEPARCFASQIGGDWRGKPAHATNS
ncbi:MULTISPECIES: hypothetical protein [Nostocales]|uniref:hypothetical protein n=1 Tax=Nostocales TaxID=1161 RepID=UPI001689C415|nr:MULTISPECIES: hypothetical protein [Nostocales]MBD2301143.1 hypothetical protein [Nostoc sp. FACHB-190]MBD2491148.1 hypothetical protein [Aulosira sp. FACHB-615]